MKTTLQAILSCPATLPEARRSSSPALGIYLTVNGFKAGDAVSENTVPSTATPTAEASCCSVLRGTRPDPVHDGTEDEAVPDADDESRSEQERPLLEGIP